VYLWEQQVESDERVLSGHLAGNVLADESHTASDQNSHG
jgi:hypothetical protein